MIQVQQLILYKNFKHQDIFDDITWLMNHYEDEYYNQEDLTVLLYENMHKLVELTVTYGFCGNVWHNFLAFLIANNENAYSTSCEIVGKVGGSINALALHDFKIFQELFAFDMRRIDRVLGVEAFSFLDNYINVNENSKIFNKRIRDRIHELSCSLASAGNVEIFSEAVLQFYHGFGVGKLGLHKAFCISKSEFGAEIEPVTNIEHVYLRDLVGYEIQKKKLTDNTEAFIEGKKANNVLLFGDAGTGKSSSVKALLNEYYDRGLRMIEVYKHQFRELPSIISQIKNRNYKFIIYMDDLSFEDYEIEYKYLKAVIEGGMEKKPDNVLIYATSNRRHLIREKFSDKAERIDDLHGNDTVQEKLSLVARFGVQVYFGAPEKKEFQEIVKELAKRYQINLEEETLLQEANKWELFHGGLSGRTAQQFINYLLGQI